MRCADLQPASSPPSLEPLESRVLMSTVISDEGARVPGIRGPLIAVGDFDQDGRPDAVVHRQQEPGRPRAAVVWLGREGGKFRRAGVLPWTRALSRRQPLGFELLAGRFTSDGQLDLVLLTRSGMDTRVRLFAGDGTGSFELRQPATRLPGRYGARPAAMDGALGRQTIVLNRAGVVSLLKLRNDGEVGRHVEIGELQNADLWSIADVNGDGRDDVVGDNAAFLSRGRLRVRTALYGGGAGADSLFVGDLNLDGRMDLVHNQRGEVFVRFNTTAGPQVQFAAPVLWASVDVPTQVPFPYGPTGAFTHIAGIGDVDGDGHADVLLGHRLTGDYRVPYVEISGWLVSGGAVSSDPSTRTARRFDSTAGVYSDATFFLIDLGGDGRLDVVHTEYALIAWRALDDAAVRRPTIDSIEVIVGGNTGRRTSVSIFGVDDGDGRVTGMRMYLDVDFSGDISPGDYDYSYDIGLVDAQSGEWSGMFLDFDPPGPRRLLVIAVDDLGFWSEISAADYTFP